MAHEWHHAFTRIQIEYIEMPDLKLTLEQIRRLCDLPDDLCQPAVAALEEVGFLWRAPDGRFDDFERRRQSFVKLGHRPAPILESTLLARRGGFSGAIVGNRGRPAKQKNSKLLET